MEMRNIDQQTISLPPAAPDSGSDAAVNAMRKEQSLYSSPWDEIQNIHLAFVTFRVEAPPLEALEIKSYVAQEPSRLHLGVQIRVGLNLGSFRGTQISK